LGTVSSLFLPAVGCEFPEGGIATGRERAPKVNGAKTGVGIVMDCIRPIMAGTPQGVPGVKPLPQIDSQVVAACQQRNPNFGMARKLQPNGQPTTDVESHLGKSEPGRAREPSMERPAA
jgi:hypothetical protein